MKLFQKYGGVLQCIVAAVNALTAIDHDHRDEVLSAEKVPNFLLDLSCTKYN